MTTMDANIAAGVDPNAQRALVELLPALHTALAELGTEELEIPDGRALKTFKTAGGPMLLIPGAFGGLGAGALAACRVQRALGASSPSLAIGTTMHHFSVASLVQAIAAGQSSQNLLLEAVAHGNLLLASAFAEGRPGGSVVRPAVRLSTDDQGYRLDGVKKPCSLSYSMDLITVSAIEETPDGEELVVIAVDARSQGVSAEKFWTSPILAASESHAVRFDGVRVGAAQMVRVGAPGDAATDDVQRAGFAWFTLLMIASYLGVLSRLVDAAVLVDQQPSNRRLSLASQYWNLVRSLETLAVELDGCEELPDDVLTAQLLALRITVEVEAQKIAAEAATMIGGRALAGGDPSLNIHHPALQCLAFHPPRACESTDSIIATLVHSEPLRIF
ncbi:MAG: acyl-CoA dehydrogenase family protein [Gordonia sp. (in: high G+C Gram-positive bacteria)]